LKFQAKLIFSGRRKNGGNKGNRPQSGNGVHGVSTLNPP
jgi:hypothetical protein